MLKYYNSFILCFMVINASWEKIFLKITTPDYSNEISTFTEYPYFSFSRK